MTTSARLAFRDIPADRAEHLVSVWTLRNACVVFRHWRGTLHRAQWVSRAGLSAVIHSFSEYSFGFGRLSFVRPEEPSDGPAIAACRRRPLGLAFTMSSNNLYHQFFHAVPAYLALRKHADVRAGTADGLAGHGQTRTESRACPHRAPACNKS